MGLIILLILAGLLLLFAEIMIIPGIGAAGILGVIALAGSCYYAFVYMGVTSGILVTLANIILVSGLLVFLLRAKTWKKLKLDTVIDSKATANVSVKAGMQGKTVTRLAPMGTAVINDKNCEVTSVDGMLDPGVPVEVAKVENNKIYVKILILDK